MQVSKSKHIAIAPYVSKEKKNIFPFLPYLKLLYFRQNPETTFVQWIVVTVELPAHLLSSFPLYFHMLCTGSIKLPNIYIGHSSVGVVF